MQNGRTGPDSPADDPADDHGGSATAMALTRWLGRLPVAGATALLVLLATACAVLAATLLVAAGVGTDFPEIQLGAAAITIAIAWPIIHSAQRVIRELRASRLAQKRMAERLAWALHRAEQASGEKSRFLATMSHELRTPLNAVIGFSDMLMHERLGPLNLPRYREYAGDINSSGRHLLGIINEILDLAKIEAGEMRIDEAEQCDLAAAIADVGKMLGPEAQRRKVGLTVRAPDPPVRLRAMDRMVRQILINILSNAVKFTPEGGTVLLAPERRSNGNLLIAVTDTGIGMTAEEVRIALSPFGQVPRAQQAGSSGTGLGLPLARAMMELHGGRMTVRSAPGTGTAIALIFPAARIVAGAPAG